MVGTGAWRDRVKGKIEITKWKLREGIDKNSNLFKLANCEVQCQLTMQERLNADLSSLMHFLGFNATEMRWRHGLRSS